MEDRVGAQSETYERIALRYLKENHLPGVSAGIVHGGGLVWMGGYGYYGYSTGRHPDARTLYRIASITKTFTATAVMRLCEAGTIDMDDPVTKFIPEFADVSSPYGRVESVTVGRLLSHESSLQRDPPGTDWRVAVYEGDLARNLSRVGEISTRGPAHSQFRYSNLGYQILGEIVTRASGIDYQDYIRTFILKPLKMSFTSFEPLSTRVQRLKATGYLSREFSDYLEESSGAPRAGSEGGLWSSVNDLSRWLIFQLGQAGKTGEKILSNQTRELMQRPRYLSDAGWTSAMGIGWSAVRTERAVWIQHSGGLPGYTSCVCFHPADRIGVVVLFNGTADASALAMELGDVARDAVLSAPPEPKLPRPIPEPWKDYVGVYLGGGSSILRIEWKDGKLAVIDTTNPEWTYTLAPSGEPDGFVVEAGNPDAGNPLRFERGGDGKVRAMVSPSSTALRLAPVE